MVWIITIKKRSRFEVFCYGVGRQIGCEKVQLKPSKQPSDKTISRKNVKKSPSLLRLEKFIKARKLAENYNLIHLVGLNFEHFQRISKRAQELLLIYFPHIVRTLPRLQECVKRLRKISFIIYFFKAFVTYTLRICCFEFENNVQLQSPKINFGILTP